MERRIEQLADNEYDVLVIGAGILGLFIAWDAAGRGLSVALIDKGDFGGATSSNSLRIIHGGFRYLQSLDLSRTRRFMREQGIFSRMAPHLVRPMPVVVPVYGGDFLMKQGHSAAIKLYGLLGSGLEPPLHGGEGVYRSRILSRKECIGTIPGIETGGLDYGLAFTDYRLSKPGRLSIQVAASASAEGAQLANYVEALRLDIKDDGVRGACVRDLEGGGEFGIRARITVNSCGPWLGGLAPGAGEGALNVKAFNLLLNKDLTGGCALGLESRIKNPHTAEMLGKRSRYLFVTPSDGLSLAGTWYLTPDPEPRNFKPSREEIDSFLGEVNASWPRASLSADDVTFAYTGYIPGYKDKRGGTRIGVRNYIHDHEKAGGPGGLLSVRGSKYTEARIIAEETVDLIMRKTGRAFRPSDTGSFVYGDGGPGDLEGYIAGEADENRGVIGPESVRRLILTYGRSYGEVLGYLGPGNMAKTVKTDEAALLKAQIVHAVRNEMALRLPDAVFRRIGLGAGEVKSRLPELAAAMGDELGWNGQRIKRETDEASEEFPVPE